MALGQDFSSLAAHCGVLVAKQALQILTFSFGVFQLCIFDLSPPEKCHIPAFLSRAFALAVHTAQSD
jgi:hypothetical protein